MKYIIIIFVFITCISSTCKSVVGGVYSIKVVNNSAYDINFFDSRVYPDTSLPIDKPYYSFSRPNDYGYIDNHDEWETVFKDLPRDTLSIFILYADTVKTQNWSIIQSQKKYLKRYDLSLQDLQNSNWTITYP